MWIGFSYRISKGDANSRLLHPDRTDLDLVVLAYHDFNAILLGMGYELLLKSCHYDVNITITFADRRIQSNQIFVTSVAEKRGFPAINHFDPQLRRMHCESDCLDKS
jgi:hypothetical protein